MEKASKLFCNSNRTGLYANITESGGLIAMKEGF